MFNVDWSLYLCTDRKLIGNANLEDKVEQAIKGGVTVVQVREKDCSDREFFEVALRLKKITDKYKVPLIINDRVDIALAVDATGVHVGQGDLSCTVVKKIIGSKIVGVSTATVEEAMKAEVEGADYVGVGAMFSTQTKSNTRPVSVDTLKLIKSKIKIPVIAIGGINQKALPKLQSTGIDGVAVVSAILASENPQQSATELLNYFNTMT